MCLSVNKRYEFYVIKCLDGPKVVSEVCTCIRVEAMFDIHGPWLVRAAPAARIVKYSQKEGKREVGV